MSSPGIPPCQRGSPSNRQPPVPSLATRDSAANVDGTPAQHQSQKPCFSFTTPMALMPATARPLTSRDTGDRTAEMVSAMTHRWLLVEAKGN